MKNFHLVIILFFSLSTLYSQNKATVFHTVRGQVINSETNLPLEFATVSFQQKSDGIMPIGTITDAKGNFKIELPKGIYDITIDFLSFQPIYLKEVVIQKNLTLDTFAMKIAVEGLEEVNVAGTNKSVSLKLDRLVYYVDKDLTSAGASALSALSNIPSVAVNPEGRISLRNDENVKILINGRPSALGNSNVLNNLQAEAIEKVEVITVPSARYSATGTAGIINIILKKNKKYGFNGSLNLTAGNPDYYGIATNINLKKGQFNLFNSTGYIVRNSPGNAMINNQYIVNNAVVGNLHENRDYKRDKNVFNNVLGFDYDINPTTALNAAFTLNMVDGVDKTSNISHYADANNLLIESFEKKERNQKEDNLYELSLSYTKNFSKEGQYLNLNYSYSKSDEQSNSVINHFNTFPSTDEDLSKKLWINDKSTTNNQNFGFVYNHPMGKSTLLEIGNENTLGDLKTDYDLRNFSIASQTFVLNPNYSTIFNYIDKIYAFYAKIETSYKKLSFSTGLRTEISDISFGLANSPNTYESKETDFFPSLHLSYEFSDIQSISLSYGKRIFRPNFWMINPFETKISEQNIVIGNPALIPFFSDIYDLKHLKKWEKLTFSTSIYLKDYTDVPDRITFSKGETINGKPIEITTYKNISTITQIGLEFFANYTPLKWWQLSGGFNVYDSKQRGKFNFVDAFNVPQTINLDSDDSTGSANASTTINFPKQWRFQTNYRYNALSQGAISKRLAYQFVNASLSKEFWNNNATLTFSVSDLFNSNKLKRTINTAVGITDNVFQWSERFFVLNFNYRFNQKEKKPLEIDKDKVIMF
ncbi:MAG: TonB-dependent receptor [Flavobacteriaceae bacterium]|nr:TonB-dependent receptor [Flavobacteriaceae bacterium]